MHGYSTIFARRTRGGNGVLERGRLAEMEEAYEELYRGVREISGTPPGGDWLHSKILLAKNMLARPAKTLEISRTTTSLEMMLHVEP